MGLNITHTMNNSQFENRENLRNTARNILNKGGASSEATQKIIEKTIFTSNSYINPQLSIINASSQITLNNTLKETLKYLKEQANKKETKKYVLGELWESIQDENRNTYSGELLDFEISNFAKNIFAA